MSGTTAPAPGPYEGPCVVEVEPPSDLPAYVEIAITADPDVITVVERGDIGPAGAPGPPGPGLSTTVIVQAQPAAVWTLAHGLHRYPSVTLVDSAGDLFWADVAYPDLNTIVVTLGAPTAGAAYLN